MAADQAPQSLGFSRQEHWSGLPFPSPMHESEKGKWSHSVKSNPQQPHGLQPSRLLHPWDWMRDHICERSYMWLNIWICKYNNVYLPGAGKLHMCDYMGKYKISPPNSSYNSFTSSSLENSLVYSHLILYRFLLATITASSVGLDFFPVLRGACSSFVSCMSTWHCSGGKMYFYWFFKVWSAVMSTES